MILRVSRDILLAAVGCFVLAAATGVFLRFVMVGVPLPEGLEFSNIRRAHSHLMLSGWATPAAMALMAAFATPMRRVRAVLWASIVFALLAFGAFALWGYGVAEIGEARIPVAVIFSTLSMFTWYAFAAMWPRLRRDVLQRTTRNAVLCWDAALLLLVVGSLGAWGRGMLAGAKISDAFLEAAVIELFLSLYVEGFLLLVAIGLVLTRCSNESRITRIGVYLMVLGTLPEFLAFLPVQLVPPELRVFGVVGITTATLGAVVVAWSIRHTPIAAVLGALASGKLILISPEWAASVTGLGLRIPYLHVLLLGLVSWVLLQHALELRGRRAYLLLGAIWTSLLALLPTTGLWPAALDRGVALSMTAVAAALPALVVVVFLLNRFFGVVRPSLDLSQLDACPNG